MRRILCGLCLFVFVGGGTAFAQGSLVDAVDPFIGTGGHGHTFPGATLPFGMVQLSPDTRLTGWDGCSGYHYSDDIVYGFSHTHLSGTGVSDYGDILFMPVSNEVFLDSGAQRGPERGYASHFDKARESASPGSYSTFLTDYDIQVDLTATSRAGLHRYKFPQGRPASVVLDLAHRDRVIDSELIVTSDTEVIGYRNSSAWAANQKIFFVARFSRPFRHQLAAENRYVDGADTLRGTDLKAVFHFGRGGSEVMIRVGISAVDIDGARRNLEAEIPHFDFNRVRDAAHQAWSDTLDRFELEGASAEERTIFATALYHSFLAPNLYTDSDGRYRGMDDAIHTANDHDQYTVFSLWDTFRATHPLFTIVEPQRTRDFLATFLAQYEQGGRLPVWELAANETDCMIGYHSVSVIADAWVKGIHTGDGPALLEAMLASARGNRAGLGTYRRDGYIAADRGSESVSRTLEYAYDDWCIARMATALDRPALAKEFDRRAQAWRHLFDPTTGFLRPRENGDWLKPFDPRRVDFHYTEANAWQYRFAVQQDLTSFIDALGGDEPFVAAVDSMFEIDSATTGREQADITGRIGQYAQGNEPSHHIAWIFHYAGRPDRSAARVEQIRTQMYTAKPDGLIGNEDCGQMSSWYVFAALGIYPVVPGRDEYMIVPPQFPRATLNLDSATTFSFVREGDGPYIQSAMLNGEALERSYLHHAEIVAGGELRITTGAEPSDWGTGDGRPRSRINPPAIIPAPWISSSASSFRDSLMVRGGSGHPGDEFFWTTEAIGDPVDIGISAPTFTVRESCTLRMVAVHDDIHSPETRARFSAIPHDWSVEVAGTPNSQYTAGGPIALLDGRRGGTDWRTGGWVGYQGQDFVATVDFGSEHELRSAALGVLQDQRSWILLPTSVLFEASSDGETFHEIGRATHRVSNLREDVVIRDLSVRFDPLTARFLRVTARNYGPLPASHPGAGGEAFIFADEIVIDAVPVPAP